ncbi:AraC family transcriptional regulator [Shewanella insulae]|uniref:helix-turn-helix transcriptional regulator n=1 Tax=Shewanella insulae TaxID=2681496 RepID=UPI001EFED539|nr:AraC family transcriptional regulator [Shewanella insulae]MCG9737342.1 AraC family transcriptional regulator [Shewanella insulae]
MKSPASKLTAIELTATKLTAKRATEDAHSLDRKPAQAQAKEQANFSLANELGGIELLEASYQRQNFSRHCHEGYTVGVIETGAQRFYRTGGDHTAPQHSIILVNADEVHNGRSATDFGWSYRAMYPLPQQFARVHDELGGKSGDAPYFPEPVVHDKPLAELLRLTFDTLSTSDNALLRESLIYTSLARLMSRHGASRPVEKTLRPTVQLALVKQFLDDMPAADVSLDALAKLAGLSPFYLIKQFQRQYGLPPHAYQIQGRIRLAKQMIRQGGKLLEVALACGFHDQSHLNRHFKRALGVTPGQYAREVEASRPRG